VREALDAAQIGPESTVAIYGTTEMGELMFLVLRKSGVQRVVFLDESGSGEYLGALVKSPNNIDPDEYAKVLVAYPNDVESRRQNLVNAGVCPDSIITLLDPPELAAANKITEATDHC
jgi:hypothetical protein